MSVSQEGHQHCRNLSASLQMLWSSAWSLLTFPHDEKLPPIQEAEGRRSRRSVQRSLGMWQVAHPRVQFRLVRSTARWLQKARPATQLLIGPVSLSLQSENQTVVVVGSETAGGVPQRLRGDSCRRGADGVNEAPVSHHCQAFRIVLRTGAQPRRKSPLCVQHPLMPV